MEGPQTSQYLPDLKNVFKNQTGGMRPSKESMSLLEAVGGLEGGFGDSQRRSALEGQNRVVHKGKG